MYENDGGLLSPRDAYRLMLKDYPDVMDIGQMCEALGVSTKTGYKLLKDGKIEYLKIGRAYRIPKAHILRYLKITCATVAEEQTMARIPARWTQKVNNSAADLPGVLFCPMIQ